MKYRNHYCNPKFSEGEQVYYGDVEGTPEIEMIEAKNLDDFERLFHQAVDDYLDGNHAIKTHPKWGRIVPIATLAILIFVAIITCPKKEQHTSFLSNRIVSIIKDDIEKKGGDDLAYVGLYFGNSLISSYIDNSMTVDDDYLFSVGKLTLDGKENVVSVGAFGHIFTASKQQMKQMLKDNLKGLYDFSD